MKEAQFSQEIHASVNNIQKTAMRKEEREIVEARVENGTGKSRPDRLRLPFKPTVNRFREKNEKNGKTKLENGRERLGCFPDRFHGSRFQPGKFPREFPYLS